MSRQRNPLGSTDSITSLVVNRPFVRYIHVDRDPRTGALTHVEGESVKSDRIVLR